MRFAGRDRAPHARGGRRRLHHRSTACRCSTSSTTARPGTRSSTLAKDVEAAGATIINTGIGWHEARVPTIVTSVPRGGVRLGHRQAARPRCRVPVDRVQPHQHAARSPRRSSPRGDADLVSMARPFLADPDFVQQGRRRTAPTRSTPASRCNQACLDHTFKHKRATCLVNPRAGHETELMLAPTRARQARRRRRRRPGRPRRGDRRSPGAATPSSCSRPADEIGGQFNLARRIPGKEEFAETLRYFARQLELAGVKLHLGTRVDAAELAAAASTRSSSPPASTPRDPSIPGIDHPKVLDLHRRAHAARAPVGERVAIVGAGGIGFDVAEFLTARRSARRAAVDRTTGCANGASADPAETPRRAGGARSRAAPPRAGLPAAAQDRRSVGAGLGKTTGWVHRATLKTRGVEMLARRQLRAHRRRRPAHHVGGERQSRACSRSTTSCSAPARSRSASSSTRSRRPGVPVHLIGGADVAAELDAKRAIDQGTRLAATL